MEKRKRIDETFQPEVKNFTHIQINITSSLAIL